MSKFSTISDVWVFLDQIPMFSKVGATAGNFGLDNIRKFCELIVNPQQKFKSIHVAGTNGKGTTCHLLEAIYLEAGFKTGMFISPHLIRYNERVSISGNEITDEKILAFFKVAESALEEVPLTYFEISTALAFWAFADEKVDVAIIEAGLGGRLDSTNIITPELSIITSIGLDHQDILGETLEEIATEKAGIIKPGVPVVIGDLGKGARAVVRNRANKLDSPFHDSSLLKAEFNSGLVQLNQLNESYKTHFIEPVNRWNVAIVMKSTELLQEQFPVSGDNFRSALENFKGVPGRFERLHPEFQWYFSGSHNEQAVCSMIEAVGKIDVPKKVLVFSMMKDKVRKEVLDQFRCFEEIFHYKSNNTRAAGKDAIGQYIQVNELYETDIPNFLNELKTSLVIFAGSFYFYATVKRWLSE